MAYDGEAWSFSRELARARAAADAAERDWRATFAPGEDPHGAAPPMSRHPRRAETREKFRRAWAELTRLRDEAAELLEAEAESLAA
jgi:hypothetical protein